MPAASPSATPSSDHPSLVGVTDVSEITGMSKKWVYETFTAEVPPMKFGNVSKWFRWQVLAYIDAKHRAAVR